MSDAAEATVADESGAIQTTTRYVVLYESADNVAEKAPLHFGAHWARALEFHTRGDLWLIGTFADAQTEGSMAIFNTREAAEEFVAGDPFVLEGVVRRWELREWTEALGPRS
jgi:uncharacterized protein YciI